MGKNEIWQVSNAALLGEGLLRGAQFAGIGPFNIPYGEPLDEIFPVCQLFIGRQAVDYYVR